MLDVQNAATHPTLESLEHLATGSRKEADEGTQTLICGLEEKPSPTRHGIHRWRVAWAVHWRMVRWVCVRVCGVALVRLHLLSAPRSIVLSWAG